MPLTQTWHDVCDVGDLEMDRGVCVLVAGQQIALFRMSPGGEVFALSNHDPFSGANVLSRGIVGTKGDVAKVASPMYKHSFDLRTGVCLNDPDTTIPVFAVRVRDGRVEVGL